MATLHIMCGIPGSGKSTLATRIKGRIVSTDEIRKYVKGNNKVFEIAYEAIYSLLNRDIDVVFDATNTTRSKRSIVIEIGSRCNARIVIHQIKCPLAVAIRRNESRQRKLSVAAIKSFYSRFEEPKIEEGVDEILIYDSDLNLQKTVTSLNSDPYKSKVIGFPLKKRKEM